MSEVHLLEPHHSPPHRTAQESTKGLLATRLFGMSWLCQVRPEKRRQPRPGEERSRASLPRPLPVSETTANVWIQMPVTKRPEYTASFCPFRERRTSRIITNRHPESRAAPVIDGRGSEPMARVRTALATGFVEELLDARLSTQIPVIRCKRACWIRKVRLEKTRTESPGINHRRRLE